MKPHNFLSNLFYFFIIFGASHSLYATTHESLEKIIVESKNYLENEINKQGVENATVTSSALNSRVKLKQCDNKLTFEHRKKHQLIGKVSVKVMCRGIHPWSVYTHHNISLQKKVIIAKRNLPKGHIINTSDLDYLNKELTTRKFGYYSSNEYIIGQQLTRAISANDIIYQHLLTEPLMIKKGDAVHVVATRGSLSVVTPGIALSSGKRGEQIKVKNRKSSRIIQATITSSNTVEVLL